MMEGQPHVDLLLRVVAIVGEAPFAQPGQDHAPLPLLGRDCDQALAVEERPEDPRTDGILPAVGGRASDRRLRTVQFDRVERATELAEPLGPERPLDVRAGGPRVHQAREAETLQVVGDRGLAETKRPGQLLAGHRPAREQAEDPQPRGVGEGLERAQEVGIHRGSMGSGSMHVKLASGAGPSGTMATMSPAADHPPSRRAAGRPAAGPAAAQKSPRAKKRAAPGPEAAPPPPRPALPDGRPLGAHLALGNGMVRAVERARAIGADTIQIFADNPTAWRRRADLPAELPAFRARIAELGLGPIAIHAAYLVNLAGPDAELFERSIGVLVRELEAAPAYGATFVNVHIGSHRGSGIKAGVDRVAEGVERVLTAVPGGDDAAVLVLENAAGSGDAVGSTLDELGAILDAVTARGVPDSRVGICLDTAHLWAAGHDVGTPEGVDGIVAAFDARIGLRRLHMLHLNDSKAQRGSRADRHQHVAAGEIGAPGLARLLVHPDLVHAAYYLETPGMDEGYDAVNMARARDLARGLPLASLPHEALVMPGSRTRAAAAS